MAQLALHHYRASMPCLVCGEEKTVKSHILPKALMLDTRDGAPHIVTGSRFHSGAKPSQGGHFSDKILCAKHENVTSALDKYGTEFLRRAGAEFEEKRPTLSFQVSNPKPDLLSRFALSLIWREIAASPGGHIKTLGPYQDAVTSAVFEKIPLAWPMVMQRTRFHAGESRDVKLGVHPHTVRFAERNAWTLTLVGFAFFVISDKRGIPQLPDYLRANESDPATIIVGDGMEITKVGILQEIFSNMRGARPKIGPNR